MISQWGSPWYSPNLLSRPGAALRGCRKDNMGQEPNKLRDFLTENVHLPADAVGDNEMVTEAIVMYRVVSMTGDTEFLPERVDFTNSKGCSFTMAIGIHEQVRSKWEYILAEANAQDHEEEEGDEPEGI